ncbi:MAG: hypothetical protein AAB460_02520 [Patescibacteria group bacterium]
MFDCTTTVPEAIGVTLTVTESCIVVPALLEQLREYVRAEVIGETVLFPEVGGIEPFHRESAGEAHPVQDDPVVDHKREGAVPDVIEMGPSDPFALMSVEIEVGVVPPDTLTLHDAVVPALSLKYIVCCVPDDEYDR